ncbi:MAG: DMT family transporter [Candidatus Thermoplasmatota archaeon]
MIKTHIKTSLMMLTAVTFWACAFPFIKILLKELSYINLTILRFTVVAIALLTFISSKPKNFSKLKKKDIPSITLLGFFGIIVYHLGLNFGEQYVSPGAASLIIATAPVFTVTLSIIYLKEKITLKKLLGILLSLTGVIIISLWGTGGKIEINYLLGAFGVLIAAVMASLYTIAGKKMLKKYNALTLTIYAMLFGSIGLIPFLNTRLIPQILDLSVKGWSALIFLGIFSTIIAYLIWYKALEIKEASEVNIYLYAIPVISTTLSFFLVNQKITIYFILGGILVIAGLIIVNRRKRYKKQLKLTKEQ